MKFTKTLRVWALKVSADLVLKAAEKLGDFTTIGAIIALALGLKDGSAYLFILFACGGISLALSYLMKWLAKRLANAAETPKYRRTLAANARRFRVLKRRGGSWNRGDSS